MKHDLILIDEYTKEFVDEVFVRNEQDDPDLSLEFDESVEMTTFEIANQFVNGKSPIGKEIIKIPIDKSVKDYLKDVYENGIDDDFSLFADYDSSREKEEFLYSLGKYMAAGNFKKPFSLRSN